MFLSQLPEIIDPIICLECLLFVRVSPDSKTKFRQFLQQLSERPSTSLATQVKGLGEKGVGLGWDGGGEVEKPPPLVLTMGH